MTDVKVKTTGELPEQFVVLQLLLGEAGVWPFGTPRGRILKHDHGNVMTYNPSHVVFIIMSTISSPAGPRAVETGATGRRPPGSKRSTLACSPCRSVRQKCDGQPPDGLQDKRITAVGSRGPIRSPKPCSRCLSNRQECLWLPSQRCGRPRNDRKANGPAQVVSNTVGSHPTEKDVIVVGSQELGHMVTLEPANNTLMSSLSSIFTTGNGSAFDTAVADSENVFSDLDLAAPAPDSQDRLYETRDNSPFDLPPEDSFWAALIGQNSGGTDFLLEQREDRLPNSSETQNLSLCCSSLVPDSSSTEGSASRSLSVESGNEMPQVEASVLIGVELYLELAVDPPPALPEGFSPLQTLSSPTTDLSTGERSLLFAMAAAGLRMAQRDIKLAQKLYEEGCFCFEQCLSAASDGALVTLDDAVNIMYAIQACSILVPYAYGTRDVTKAKKLLLGTAHTAARFGLHLLDSQKRPKDSVCFFSMVKELERESSGCGQKASRPCYEFHSCATCLAEALRQAWWEVGNATFKKC